MAAIRNWSSVDGIASAWCRHVRVEKRLQLFRWLPFEFELPHRHRGRLANQQARDPPNAVTDLLVGMRQMRVFQASRSHSARSTSSDECSSAWISCSALSLQGRIDRHRNRTWDNAAVASDRRACSRGLFVYAIRRETGSGRTGNLPSRKRKHPFHLGNRRNLFHVLVLDLSSNDYRQYAASLLRREPIRTIQRSNDDTTMITIVIPTQIQEKTSGLDLRENTSPADRFE